MNSSDQFAQVAGALAKAQGEFPDIPKSREVRVPIKDRETRREIGSYTYKYATLDTILAAVRPALAKHGLALVQAPVLVEADGKSVEVMRTTLFHSSGEWLSCDLPVFVAKGDNAAQAYGAGLTYSRRYGVMVLLCVAADEDTDGGAEAGTEYERQGHAPANGNGFGGPRQPQGKSARHRAPDPDELDRALRESRDDGHGEPPHLVEHSPGTPEGVDMATGELVTPWGSDLTAGQLGMAKQRASVAGLDDAGVLRLCGPIHGGNIREALAKLKTAADSALEGGQQ